MRDQQRVNWLLAISFSCLMILTSCGGEAATANSAAAGWAKVVQDANAEGNVTWWTAASLSEPNRLLVEAFRKAYPKINVDVVQGPNSQLNPRFDQLQQANLPGPDVFTTFDLVWVNDHKSKGDLAKPEGPDVANYPADGFAANGFALTASQYAEALNWNQTSVPGGLKTYADLLNPRLKGHLGLLVPGSNVVLLSMYEDIERAAGPGYLQRLAAQAPFHFYLSTGSMAPATASGEIWAAIGTDRGADVLKRTGAPIAFAYPSGSKPEAFVQSVVLLKKAAHPNASRVFLNFMATKQGQAALNADGAGVSVLPNIPGALQGPALGTTVLDPTKWTSGYVAKAVSDWNATFHYNG